MTTAADIIAKARADPAHGGNFTNSLYHQLNSVVSTTTAKPKTGGSSSLSSRSSAPQSRTASPAPLSAVTPSGGVFGYSYQAEPGRGWSNVGAVFNQMLNPFSKGSIVGPNGGDIPVITEIYKLPVTKAVTGAVAVTGVVGTGAALGATMPVATGSTAGATTLGGVGNLLIPAAVGAGTALLLGNGGQTATTTQTPSQNNTPAQMPTQSNPTTVNPYQGGSTSQSGGGITTGPLGPGATQTISNTLNQNRYQYQDTYQNTYNVQTTTQYASPTQSTSSEQSQSQGLSPLIIAAGILAAALVLGKE